MNRLFVACFYLLGVTLTFAPSQRVPAAGIDDPSPKRERSPTEKTRRNVIDEVVITARRRAEAAQDVPLALSVHGRDQLETGGAWSLDRLQRVDPSVHMFGFNPRTTNISIRSLGGNVGLVSDGLESGVGVFVDEVYLGRVGPALFELVDLERVEILRGPQGTLFGRNTTAGAINLVTRAPGFDPDAIVEASVGDYGFHQIRASVSGPLWRDKLAGRMSISDTHRDGFIENVHTGERLQNFNNLTVRGQLLMTPTSGLDIRVIGDYARQETACCTAVGVGVFEELDDGTAVPNGFLARTERLSYEPLPFAPFDRKVDLDSAVRADMDQWGLSMRIGLTLTGVEVTSITAYREWDWDPANDLDYTGLPVLTLSQTANRQNQMSQELRVSSRGDRRIDYIAGFYHFEEAVDGFGSFAFGAAAPEWYFPPDSQFPPVAIEAAVDSFASASTSSAETRSDALFGQGIWHVTAAFDLSVGLRLTRERRSGRFEQHDVAGRSLSGLSPAEAAAAQAIRDNASRETSYTALSEDDALSGMLTLSRLTAFGTSYLTISRGHKAGGLNVGNLPAGLDSTVMPETVQHYEIGAKNRLFDDTTVLNVAVFRTEISDYQTSVVQANVAGGPLLQYISNIEEARSQGFELETAWSPSSRFALSAGIAYADAAYVSYPDGPCPPEVSLAAAQCDLSGQPLAGAPRRSWTLALEGEESLSGTLDFYWRVDYSRQSSLFTDVGNSRYSMVESYGLSNLVVGTRWNDRRWDLRLWMRNVLDEEYFQLAAGFTSGLIVGVPGEPRTMGVTLRGQF